MAPLPMVNRFFIEPMIPIGLKSEKGKKGKPVGSISEKMKTRGLVKTRGVRYSESENPGVTFREVKIPAPIIKDE